MIRSFKINQTFAINDSKVVSSSSSLEREEEESSEDELKDFTLFPFFIEMNFGIRTAVVLISDRLYLVNKHGKDGKLSGIPFPPTSTPKYRGKEIRQTKLDRDPNCGCDKRD